MQLVEKLPEKLTLSKGVELELDKKKHQGRIGLNDVWWYVYKIINTSTLNIEYDNICLSGCIITEDIRVEAAKHIIGENITSEQTVRPNIDFKSGNIHPSREYVKNVARDKIKQLVLCRGQGPATNEIEEGKDVYVYERKPSKIKCKVHKACYYPLISDEDSLKNDWRHSLLAEIWEKIQVSI